MKRALCIIAALLFLALMIPMTGCGNGNSGIGKDKIVGEWVSEEVQYIGFEGKLAVSHIWIFNEDGTFETRKGFGFDAEDDFIYNMQGDYSGTWKKQGSGYEITMLPFYYKGVISNGKLRIFTREDGDYQIVLIRR
ncbi:MAG: hypothetical protein J5854_06310 [Clostridia bacterium]|nr:hypothetical protein [Clostridia bacterium]